MHPLHVVCFGDGRPGHEKQSQAVLTALETMTPLTVAPIKIEKTTGIMRFLYGLYSLVKPPKHEAITDNKPIDLILGTGSITHLPMVGLKMRTRAKMVTCMMPDLWLRSLFDLCLVPRHDKPPNRSGFFATFGPPCLLPERLIDGDRNKGLILAGGIDPKSHHWRTDDLLGQIDRLISSMPDICWALASSPRTPSETCDKLRRLAGRQENIEFFSANETPPGWIEWAYSVHSQVWVSADSVSMVYEALTAGCRVGVLPVRWNNPKNKFQHGIDDLKRHGMIIDFNQWTNGEHLPITSTPLNEAERCAEEILERWWPDRLV